MPSNDTQVEEVDKRPDDIQQALTDLHQAMEMLDMAVWRLEGINYETESRVTRKLRRDLRTVRAVVDEKSRGNEHLTGYAYDHDRMMDLVRETPNAGVE